MASQTARRRRLRSNASVQTSRKDQPVDVVVNLVFKDVTGISAAQKASMAADLVNARLSVIALAPAITNLATRATPATARAVQATENVWREMEDRYGLLTSTEVAERLSAKGSNRTYASSRRAKGQLLGVQRKNTYRFPGFQFDAQTHRVKPAIEPLLALARDLNWDEDQVAIWLASPSGYFGGDRPAEHLDDVDAILAKARDEASVEW